MKRGLSQQEFFGLVEDNLALELNRPENKTQFDAITSPAETVLQIVAGPGSGKTTVLILRALWFVFVKGVAPDRILITTFTLGLLPRSDTSQFWYGELVHQTLDMCFHIWNQSASNGGAPPSFPWPCSEPPDWGKKNANLPDHDIARITSRVESRLKREGLRPRSRKDRAPAYRQISLGVNQFGPHLFPMIESAERKFSGTREVPFDSGRMYEVTGVLDTLSNVRFVRSHARNLVQRNLLAKLPKLDAEKGDFEVIVDYKGTLPPSSSDERLNRDEFQVQTYAWLRRQQPDSPPVRAAMLIYVKALQAGSQQRRGLTKAIRIVEVNDASVECAMESFDSITERIEYARKQESDGMSIIEAWYPNCRDRQICKSCDFRNFCPNPAQ